MNARSAKRSCLVDEHQAAVFRFNGRVPQTLEELAIARADHEHRRRLAEIKTMRKRLALLDAMVEKLAETGVEPGRLDITSGDSGRVLHLRCGWLFAGDKQQLQLQNALIALGFKEIERTLPYPSAKYVRLQLKQGRALLVEIEVPIEPGSAE